jgi:Type-F conjugative transfer system pilin assembly protein
MRQSTMIIFSACLMVIFFAAVCTANEPKIDEGSEAYKAAKRILEKHQSPEVQEAIKAAQQRLKAQTGKLKAQIYQDIAKKEARNLSGKHKIMVFISASMPNELTAGFVMEAGRIKDQCDTQFFINGIPRMGLDVFINSINGDRAKLNLNIDPFLFQAFNVESVPSIVLDGETMVQKPRSLKDALAVIQSAAGMDLSDLIRGL